MQHFYQIIKLGLLSVTLYVAWLIVSQAFYYLEGSNYNTPAMIAGCNEAEKRCYVELTTEVKSIEHYLELASMLQSANEDWTIEIHLAGDGGLVSTVYYLYNNVNNSKAKVVIYVDGIVQSGHAFLAFIGDELVISDTSFFMFHVPAVYDMKKDENVIPTAICQYFEDRKDRGVDAEKKCLDSVKTSSKVFLTFAQNTFKKYLTNDEYVRLLRGEDIFITGVEMKKRIQGLKNGQQ